ncbi:MAG: bifunctional folylpolyglutamate synthase/dihydrofolate synthase [Acidobacteria bacterium]|nr:bifunctional folylpolyglutamate synthase/dihydrofolate synthase [Acidobacteriota bacterium]
MTDRRTSQTLIPYDDCLKILWSHGHELHGKKFGLEPIMALLQALGSPERRYPTAIIAGTNGKGSTSAMLASILERAGYRTGLYTSPHFVRANERIRVSNCEISDEDFAAAFSEVHCRATELLNARVLTHLPSFFEYLTATAFLHFARSAVDFAVLEVGMGGRLDATNITDPSVAIITNVDLDHQQYLGKTHSEIAREKAGVIKPGRPVVSGCEHPVVREVVRRRCQEVGADLIETGGFRGMSGFFQLDGRCGFDLEIGPSKLPGITLQMAGRFQVKNAIAAATAAWRLARQGFRITPHTIRAGLRAAWWPGRLETILNRPLVMLDGAHNPAAAREIAAFIREHCAARNLRLVYATMRDKDIAEISGILFPLAETVYLTRPEVERAASPETILDSAPASPRQIVQEPDPARALERAIEESSLDDVVLVAGSLFLVGAIKKAILEGRLVLGKPTLPEVLSEYC